MKRMFYNIFYWDSFSHCLVHSPCDLSHSVSDISQKVLQCLSALLRDARTSVENKNLYRQAGQQQRLKCR